MSETPSRRWFVRRAAAASRGALGAERAVSAGDAQSVALAGSTYVNARKGREKP
jgi:hypothetical protein